MYALVTSNNEITQIGELVALFPDTSNPNHAFAVEQGALEVVEGEQKDQRFYWVTFSHYEVNGSVVTRTYTNTPKALEDKAEFKEDGSPLYVQVFDATVGDHGLMVDTTEQFITKGLKSTKITEIKITANLLLASTDWMVIRKAERNIDIPSATVAKRAAILTECDRLISAINASSDIDTFVSAINSANWGD